MDILFVVPYVPSLVRTRSYNLVRHLSARGHRVSVATVWSNERERAEVDELKACCDEVHAVHVPVWRSLLNCVRALPSSEPLQAVYSWSRALASQIISLQRKADVLHVEHLRGARYGSYVKTRPESADIPVVWDAVDCISYLFQQAIATRRDRIGALVNRLELPRTRRREGSLLRHFDRVLISSEVDKEAMVGLGRALPHPLAPGACERLVTVLPNGVDTSYFTPSNEPRRPKTLVFSGKMSYHANVSAAMHLVGSIMPLIWARQPDVRLVIVGQDPPPKLRAVAARHASLVTVTGTVPDIRPFLRQASVAVIPLVYGAGSQFKVLEAMACATPVVATPRSVVALAARAGHDILVAEHARAFADAVIELLESPPKREAIGRAGRAYVEAHHHWGRIAAQLETIYADVVTQYRGVQPPSDRGSTGAEDSLCASPSAYTSPLVP